MLCNKRIAAMMKGKVYKTVMKPALVYSLETVVLSKGQEKELEVAELKMLRYSLGVTKLDKIKSEYIRGMAHVTRLRQAERRETKMVWTHDEEGGRVHC